jgi:uncharacterized membrane protein YgcG
MKHLLITLTALLAAASSFASDTLSRPETAIWDQTGLLNADQTKAIQDIITNLETNRGAKAYLLVIDSLPAGVNILQYTKGIFKKWELNTLGDGLNYIIVYSRKEHAVRIEGSDKVIKLLTKEYLQSVTTNSMMPYFRKRQDYEALKRGMEMVALKLESN